VTIARDLGKLIDIGSGLDAADRVVESPPDGIGNGVEVQIAENPKAVPLWPGRPSSEGTVPVHLGILRHFGRRGCDEPTHRGPLSY